MADQIKGTKLGKVVTPTPCGDYLRGANIPAIAEQTQSDMKAYRPSWATDGSAAKGGMSDSKAPAQSAVGAQFPARRR